MEPAINFCCTCAAPVVLKVPAGDSLPRHVCEACGAIHYRNPRLVIGTLPVWEDRVLLCRRAIEPRKGCWTLPAGFMENQESLAEAAARETREEASAQVELDALYTMISVPHINQVHVIYRAHLRTLDFAPGDESLEVALFAEADIPWEDIAFRTVAMTLRHYFADRVAGSFGPHVETIRPL
jgi:ADP-ribose pyrophosphatase YjhB (NUDIX family)